MRTLYLDEVSRLVCTFSASISIENETMPSGPGSPQALMDWTIRPTTSSNLLWSMHITRYFEFRILTNWREGPPIMAEAIGAQVLLYVPRTRITTVTFYLIIGLLQLEVSLNTVVFARYMTRDSRKVSLASYNSTNCDRKFLALGTETSILSLY